jgi:hypothetical protein
VGAAVPDGHQAEEGVVAVDGLRVVRAAMVAAAAAEVGHREVRAVLRSVNE